MADFIREATLTLENAGIGTARLDALVLLGDATKLDRSYILAHPEYQLADATTQRLEQQITRRSRHEPLAYIRNKSEFYGRDFYINRHVLEPRPESETMIDLLRLEVGSTPEKYSIVDLGTGSGALAITAKLELPGNEVIAIDIDPACLEVARKNAKGLHADITLLKSDLLGSLVLEPSCSHLCVLANLPYVPDSHTVNEAATWEPKHAIFGGSDGLELYRRLFLQLGNNGLTGVKDMTIFTESLPFQHNSLGSIAQEAGFRCTKEQDFIQVFQRV